MKPTDPPGIATWMLEHCTSGGSDSSLRGDLEEEFRAGRSASWYWRQALAAIAIGCLRNLRNHRNAIVFAALWSLLAPAWLLLTSVVTERVANTWNIWRFDWPWSAIFSSVFSVAPGLVFLLAGALTYLTTIVCVNGRLSIRRISRGLFLSVLVFLAISAALAWAAVLFPTFARSTDQRGPALTIAPPPPNFAPRALGGGRDSTVVRDKSGTPTVRTEARVYALQNSPWPPEPFQLEYRNAGTGTPLTEMEKGGAWPIFNRMIFFLTLLCALWPAEPLSKRITR